MPAAGDLTIEELRAFEEANRCPRTAEEIRLAQEFWARQKQEELSEMQPQQNNENRQ